LNNSHNLFPNATHWAEINKPFRLEKINLKIISRMVVRMAPFTTHHSPLTFHHYNLINFSELCENVCDPACRQAGWLNQIEMSVANKMRVQNRPSGTIHDSPFTSHHSPLTIHHKKLYKLPSPIHLKMFLIL
jgi:hypothetical protein